MDSSLNAKPFVTLEHIHGPSDCLFVTNTTNVAVRRLMALSDVLLQKPKATLKRGSAHLLAGLHVRFTNKSCWT